MPELLKLHADMDPDVAAYAAPHVDDEAAQVRPYRPADRQGVRRLYSDGLLEGQVDPDESTRDLDDLLTAYFSRAGDHFWVAEWHGRIVGMIGVRHVEPMVGQVRRLRVDRAFRETDLPARLLRLALHHCRLCGDLKLVLDTHVDPYQAVHACRDGGFQYTRQRHNGGRATLEFYLNLYQQPRLAGAVEQPHRAPRPPRLRFVTA